MEINDETIEWAADKLSRLNHLHGFPRSEEAVLGVCRSFLRIIGDQGGPTKNELDPATNPDWDYAALGPLYEVLPHVAARDTADWLIDRITDGCDRFPPPIVMRRLYEENGWTPGDGRHADELAGGNT